MGQFKDFMQQNQYVSLKRIGCGGFATVYKAKHALTNTFVAVKRMKQVTDEKPDGFMSQMFVREVSILRQCKHQNIVRILDQFIHHTGFIIVMEYGGDTLESYLSECLKHKRPEDKFTLNFRHTVMKQLLSGLNFLHQRAITHRDLKPGNILISNNNETVKIADLGLAKRIASATVLTTCVETLWYRAPELLLNCETYCEVIDVWSLGCIYGELCGCNVLMPGSSEKEQITFVCATVGMPPKEHWQPNAYVTWDAISKLVPNAKCVTLEIKLSDHSKMGLSSAETFERECDFTRRLLSFDANQRLTASQAFQEMNSWVENGTKV